MAVIREQRQFSIGPIGVARASQGGAITGEAISRSADQLADIFFKAGAQQAEKRGFEAGASAPLESVMTLDPATGKPEAINAAKEFGTISAEAYEKVIRSRYQKSLDDEMRAKGQELAVKYEQNPNGAALFETAMADYIASMSNVAESEYKGYIQDTGTAYLQATRSNLAANQVRRERAAAAEAQANTISEGLDSLELVYASDPNNLDLGENLGESILQSARDGAAAGILKPNVEATTRKAIQSAKARGILRAVTKSIDNPSDLVKISAAIGTGNPNLLPPGYDNIGAVISGFGADYSSLAEFEAFAAGILDDQLQFANLAQKEELDAAKAMADAAIFNINAGTPSLAFGDEQIGFRFSPATAAAYADNIYRLSNAQIQSLLNNGRKDEADALIAQRDTRVKATLAGIIEQGLTSQPLTAEQTQQLEAAIFDRNPAKAPTAASARALEAVLQMRVLVPDALDDFLKVTGEYRDAPAKYNERIQKAQADAALMQMQPSIVGLNTQRGANIATEFNRIVADLNALNLKPEDRERAFKDAALNAGHGFVAEFAANASDFELEQGFALLTGGNFTGLSPSQQALLSSAREYYDQADNRSAVTTNYNDQAGARRSLLSEIEKRSNDARNQFDAYLGLGDPSSERNQKYAEDYITANYASVIAGQTLTQILSNSAEFSKPKYRPMLNEIARMGNPPKAIVDILKSTSTGTLSGEALAAGISHWRALRTKTDPVTGSSYVSPLSSALSMQERTKLDLLSEYGRQVGDDPQAIRDAVAAVRQYETDPRFKEAAEKIDDMVMSIDGIQDIPQSVYAQVKASALVYSAFGGVFNLDEGQIKARLKEQIDLVAPDGGGIVLSQSYGRRSVAALSKTVGENQDAFLGVVRSRIETLRPFTADGYELRTNAYAIGDISTIETGEKLAEAGESPLIGRLDSVFLRPTMSGGMATRPDPVTGEPQRFASYQVMMNRPIDEGGPQPLYVISIDEEGNRQAIPFIMNSDDPLFRMKVENTKRQMIVDAQSEIEDRNRRIQETINAPAP